LTAVVVCSHLLDEGHFRSERWPTAPVLCREHEPLDYWAGLNRFWRSPADLVLVEHDIEVTDEHVRELLDCPHALCSWAYRANWISSGFAGGVIAAGTGARDSEYNPDPGYLQGGEEWAAWSAIGLVKVTAEARVGPLRAEPWQRLELAVHDAVNQPVRRPWHMHWPPVNHWHW
jgi:hypothetical protein